MKNTMIILLLFFPLLSKAEFYEIREYKVEKDHFDNYVVWA